MQVVEVTEPAGWNEFVAACPYGDILQSWEWGEVKRGELWGVIRARVVDNNQTVGQMQVLTRKLPANMSLYYVPRGPVLDYDATQSPEILAALVDWIRPRAQADRALMIKMGPAIPEDRAAKTLQTFATLGLKKSFRSVQAQHTRIVDLSPSEADILTSFDKDTRNLVRRAAREGVVVDKSSHAEDLKLLRAFHNMYTITSDRGAFPARPWEQFTRSWELMAPARMMTCYVASFEDQPLAGAIVLQLGKKAYYLWAGSRRDVQKKFAPYATQWAIMQDLKSQGVTSYDMWGIPPTDDPKHPWAGLGLFKKGFSGERVDYIGDYDLPLSPIYPIFTTADRVRQRVFGQRGS